MKIIKQTNKKQCFKDLKKGTPFLFQNCLYLKTDRYESATAVNLEKSELSFFSDECLIEIVEAEIILKS